MPHESTDAREATNHRHRWQVKDFIVSPWRALPGVYTPTEIFQLRLAGRFLLAAPMLEELIGEDETHNDLQTREGTPHRVG